MSNPQIALQLYTVRDETARDFAGTVRKVAKIGYKAVEFAGYGDLEAAELQALLEETGIHPTSTHLGLEVLEKELDKQIDYCKAIHCPYLVLPWVGEEYRNAASMKQLGSQLNSIGRRLKDHDLCVAYHNHHFEFEKGDDGRYLLDSLLDEADPELVKLELDTYWAAYAGVDPIAYLKQHRGRVPLVHLKDMAKDRSFTEVGDGVLDTKGICAAAQEAGALYYIVENDAPTMPSLESAQRSLENLQKLLGLA